MHAQLIGLKMAVKEDDCDADGEGLSIVAGISTQLPQQLDSLDRSAEDV